MLENKTMEELDSAEIQDMSSVQPEASRWYERYMSLEDAKAFIKANIATAARSFIAIAFQLAAVAQTLQEEMDICTDCPNVYNDEQCTGCGTYWNMRDLRLDFETIQQRLIKAAAEV